LLSSHPKPPNIDVEAIGFHHQRRLFVDRNDLPIRSVSEQYPWEWMFRARFAPHLLEHPLHWLEAP
jgi:glutathionylspermidine synthase